MSPSNTKSLGDYTTAGTLYVAVLIAHLALLTVVRPSPPSKERFEIPLELTCTVATTATNVAEADLLTDPPKEKPAPSTQSLQPPREIIAPSKTIDQPPLDSAPTPNADPPMISSEGPSVPNIPASATIPADRPPPGAPAVSAPNFHAAIVHHLEERKVYPAAARNRGIEGAVTIRFIVQPNGNTKNVQVEGKNAHRYLRQAAVESVRSATPFPLPGVPDGDIEVLVTIAYQLKE